MLKLREPFSLKVHLHIRQNMLQRLWDKYVPESAPEYERIELIYRKDEQGMSGRQPEQIQLLLQLIIKNKRLQMNLLQYPTLVKVGQKQLEKSLQRIERYYMTKLKSCDYTTFRTVKQYFALLDQVKEGSRRYESWENTYKTIETQREEYRQLSLFSEKLRTYVEEYSENTLRTMERELIQSLSETEYQTLTEALIWQEKPGLISYLDECEEARCRDIVSELEKDIRMIRVLSSVALEQPVKEQLIAAVNRMGKKELCLFYRQVTELEDIRLQTILWETDKSEMLHSIDRLEAESLQQMWRQLEAMAHLPGPEKSELITYFKECSKAQCGEIARELESDARMGQIFSSVREEPSVRKQLIAAVEQMEQEEFYLFYQQLTEKVPSLQEKSIQDQSSLRKVERKLVDSLSDTEYRSLAEKIIWEEKPELIAYFKECSKAQCKEIARELEKDSYMGQVLSSIQKQSTKKKLVAAASQLEAEEFCRFYWKVVGLEDVNPKMVIWEPSRTGMLRSIDELSTESLQKAWGQMEAVNPVGRAENRFSEQLLRLQEEYRQKGIESFQKQISILLEQSTLEQVTDLVDVEQLIQDISMVSGVKTPTGGAEMPEAYYNETARNGVEAPEVGYGSAGQQLWLLESDDSTLWAGAQRVIRELEQECELRRERIELQQAQAFEIYQEAYRQILKPKDILVQMQENTAQFVEQTFRGRQQVTLTREEIRTIGEWSKTFLEAYFLNQEQELVLNRSQAADAELTEGQVEAAEVDFEEPGDGFSAEKAESSFSSNRKYKLEFIHVIRQMNRYIEEQQGSGEHLALNWKRNLPKDENIQKLLGYIRGLEEPQRDQFIQHLAGQAVICQRIQLSMRDNAYDTTEQSVSGGAYEPTEVPQQNHDRQILDVPDEKLREWGEVLLFHPEYAQESGNTDLLSGPQQQTLSFDKAQQEDVQTQLIRQQIEMAKERNSLQRLIRQVNHRADTELVYTDAQLRLPEVQTLLRFVRQLDEKQYGILVNELAYIAKGQEQPYESPKKAESVHTEESRSRSAAREFRLEQRRDRRYLAASYPVLVQRIQDYETRHRVALYRELEKTEQEVFRQVYGQTRRAAESRGTPIEAKEALYGLPLYEESGGEYELALYDEAEKVYAQMRAQRGKNPASELRYQPQELEYFAQKAQASEEERQRSELRMQQETAQIRSVQEQLDKKLQEVEHQLKRVEGETKEKEDVRTFSEQVKKQLYEELHVERLRRGLI